ncbi:YaeQ family protein [Nocardia cyriacigeorgica]|uniref:YaeQ family protein n=1 Tax=Nocardia cyriacigeorgica TaxID=135487 RepID=A0A6P1DA53_9NOCA|nr:YaeQ family protein [Nocardia cyriacigeorgica]NEW45760.1 YaeQ family protein [Nocardia cyriacigeorgica]NEW51980.1 YaeQ family protein [Nocardia cyriacigeorgica]
MALSATLYTFTIQLADVDRGVYQDLELRVARHPSETAEFMLTRLLAYCLEHEDGITFSDGGVSSTNEPAVLVRDLTGRLTTWIDIGAPDADRIHRAAKLADRVAIYTHRDPTKVLAALTGKRIHRADTIPLYSFDREVIESAAAAIDRRTDATISVTERLLYLDLNGSAFSTAIEEHRLT